MKNLVLKARNKFLNVKRPGTLRFWGDWFGRPHDNYHIVETSELTENQLVLRFNNGEVCTITEPVGIVSTKNRFYVKDAKKIRWEWFYYGSPKASENLCVIEYERVSVNTISKQRDDTKFEKIDPKRFYALEIL